MTNTVDPIILSMRLSDPCEPPVCACGDAAEVPAGIAGCFPGELNMGGEGRRVYVTLGQFSIIRLERDSQLLIPAYDYCMPSKEWCRARIMWEALREKAVIFSTAMPIPL